MTLISVDANILFYAVDGADSKQNAALAIVAGTARAGGLIMLQALGEFFSSTVRKKKLTAAEATRQIGFWSIAFGPPVAGTAAALADAMAATAEGRFSFWEAMLLATAEAAGCTAIISEDMAPGARLGRIRVIPAFAGDAVSPEALALLA